MKRRLLFLLILVVLLIGTIWWFMSRRPAAVTWQGYAEADFVKIGPTQQGRLTAVRVARGNIIQAGVPLFDQDDVSDQAALTQAKHDFEQSAGTLANLQAPSRKTETAQAEANLAAEEATRDRLLADLKRLDAVVPAGGAKVQERDQTRADLLASEAKVRGLQAALEQARAPTGREPQILSQKAASEASQAAVAIAEWRLSQRHVIAPQAGVVADVMARPGETLDAGTPVVSLLPPGNIFIRFFVPEDMLAQVHHGDRVGLSCDHCPSDLVGTVSFIAPQAEYTPPVIYSDAQQAKLVYLMEARPAPDQAHVFNPGQPVLVRPLKASDTK